MVLKWSQLPLLLLVSLLFLTNPHAPCFYIFYCGIFSASFLITFLFLEIETSIHMHVLLFSLSQIIMSGLLLGMFCQFALADSITWLSYLQDFLLILVHSYTTV